MEICKQVNTHEQINEVPLPEVEKTPEVSWILEILTSAQRQSFTGMEGRNVSCWFCDLLFLQKILFN